MTGLQLEISIVEQCNLNCAYCTHFAPCVTEPELLPVEAFKRDIERLGEITNGKIDYLKIMGGEPLLHPELERFLICARQNFQDGQIDLYTNGILLKDKTPEFWETCRRFDIRIVSAKYPTTNHEQIQRLCAANGVALWWASEPEKVMTHYKFDLDGTQDGEYQHRICTQLGTNPQLRDGKLYPCSRPANIRHFNKFFRRQLEPIAEDGLDIHADGVTLETLKEHLFKRIPFCRYCKNDCAETAKWKPSQQKMEEWT